MNDMNKTIKVLMDEIKIQHKMRLEDGECGGCEIEESFDILKARLTNTLLEKGVKEFQLLDQIAKF